MNIYRITRFTGDTPIYRDTLKAAQTQAKEGMERRRLNETRVDLIDVAVDKAGILVLLNGFGNGWGPDALRTWRLSPRGGLAEITAGE